MQIIAHRGWWSRREEKNSSAAFQKALRSGFGIETDLRDKNGRIVISHDMPKTETAIDLEDFLNLCVELNPSALLALNIKADGLQVSVKRLLVDLDIKNAFVFDMSVPDALGYIKEDFKVYTRHSEYESVPAFYEKANGVWIDGFVADWFDAKTIEAHLDAGKSVALVSPELHGRTHQRAWESWKGIKHPELSLCTDFPDAADAFFNQS